MFTGDEENISIAGCEFTRITGFCLVLKDVITGFKESGEFVVCFTNLNVCVEGDFSVKRGGLDGVHTDVFAIGDEDCGGDEAWVICCVNWACW